MVYRWRGVGAIVRIAEENYSSVCYT
jgi:hypothetical protein